MTPLPSCPAACTTLPAQHEASRCTSTTPAFPSRPSKTTSTSFFGTSEFTFHARDRDKPSLCLSLCLLGYLCVCVCVRACVCACEERRRSAHTHAVLPHSALLDCHRNVETKVVHEVVNDRWEVCMTLSDTGFQQVSSPHRTQKTHAHTPSFLDSFICTHTHTHTHTHPSTRANTFPPPSLIFR